MALLAVVAKLRRQLLVANGLGGRGQLSDQLLQAADHADHAALVEVALIPGEHMQVMEDSHRFSHRFS